MGNNKKRKSNKKKPTQAPSGSVQENAELVGEKSEQLENVVPAEKEKSPIRNEPIEQKVEKSDEEIKPVEIAVEQKSEEKLKVPNEEKKEVEGGKEVNF